MKTCRLLARMFLGGVAAAGMQIAMAAPVVVGQVGPMSGLEANQGRAYAAGMQLLFAGVNKAGGVNGHTFTLVRKDDGGRPEETAAVGRFVSVHASPSKTGSNSEDVVPGVCPGTLTLGNLVWDWHEELARHTEPGYAERNELCVTYLTDAHRAAARELLTLLDGLAPVPPIDPEVRAEIRALPVEQSYEALRADQMVMASHQSTQRMVKHGLLLLLAVVLFATHWMWARRQREAAEVYAAIIADDVITLERIGDFLMDGPRGDRTRQMIATAMRPAIDKAAGPLRGAARVVVGADKFDNIRESFAMEAVGRTITPFRDAEFSRQQSEKIRVLIARRTKELPPRDFVEMMRSAIKEDEWMLYAHGAIMGAAGGIIHLGLFNWGWIPGFPP